MKNMTSGNGTYQAYTGFAEVYDRFMENVPYDDWEAWISSQLEASGYAGQLVLELGCGTGIMTERLAARGYDMIGVDLSEDMLAEAMEKRSLSGHNILYLQQDMRGFELYGTVAAVVCICDSLNYITARRDLTQVFRLVNNYLDPGGLFLFDFNTPAAYLSPLREHPIVEEADGITMIWENGYRPQEALNDPRVTFFLPVAAEAETVDECDGPYTPSGPQEDGDPLYMKVQELHEQRAYTLEEIRDCLAEAGLTFCEAVDADTKGEVTAQTQRVLCVARECGKSIQIHAKFERRSVTENV